MELTKICSCCSLEKSFNNFHINKKGAYGLHNKCKDCRNNINKEKNFIPLTTGTKLCIKCNNSYSISEFSRDKSNKSGLQTYCKKCSRSLIKRSTSTFDGYINKIYLDLINNSKKIKTPLEIDITIDDIKNIYHKQNGNCALSGLKMTFDTYMTNDNQIINRYNMSIDLINNNYGYKKNNIQLVCAMVHKMKNVYTNDEFIDMCKQINKFNNPN